MSIFWQTTHQQSTTTILERHNSECPFFQILRPGYQPASQPTSRWHVPASQPAAGICQPHFKWQMMILQWIRRIVWWQMLIRIKYDERLMESDDAWRKCDDSSSTDGFQMISISLEWRTTCERWYKMMFYQWFTRMLIKYLLFFSLDVCVCSMTMRIVFCWWIISCC